MPGSTRPSASGGAAFLPFAALPGPPRQDRPVAEVVGTARVEARLLVDAGFDAIIIENMHDVPYLRGRAGPEIVAAMTCVAEAIRSAVDVPMGVQILAGANREARMGQTTQ